MNILKSFKIKNHQGFTLLELLTVIAIVGIFSTFLIVKFNAQDKKRDLKNAALVMTQNLRRLQTLALAGEEINGVSIRNYHFFIADSCSNGCHYELWAEDASGARKDIENIYLKNDIALGLTGLGALDIIFLPPNIKSSSSVNQYSILLTYDSETACVTFNQLSGRIDISDICPN